MPEMPDENNISIKRKKLLFRSWHRGTREMDLLLGRFAEAHLEGFDAAELALYEALLSHNDPDIYNWVSGLEPLPAAEDHAVFRRLLDFYA